jgi:hypothetical protein
LGGGLFVFYMCVDGSIFGQMCGAAKKAECVTSREAEQNKSR